MDFDKVELPENHPFAMKKAVSHAPGGECAHVRTARQPLTSLMPSVADNTGRGGANAREARRTQAHGTPPGRSRAGTAAQSERGPAVMPEPPLFAPPFFLSFLWQTGFVLVQLRPRPCRPRLISLSKVKLTPPCRTP